MTLDPIAIATKGYVCGGCPDDISIATKGYVCVAVVVEEVPRGGDSDIYFGPHLPAEWWELKGVTPEQLRQRLIQEDEEILQILTESVEFMKWLH